MQNAGKINVLGIIVNDHASYCVVVWLGEWENLFTDKDKKKNTMAVEECETTTLKLLTI